MGTTTTYITPASTVLACLRARGIAEDDLDDDAVELLTAECLREFSRYRPLIVVTTFETVADQQAYSFATDIADSNGQSIILCVWNPYQTGDEWDLARTLSTLGVPREAGYWHLPSQDMLEQIKAAFWQLNYGGHAFQHDTAGGDIYLTPTPDESGDTVYLVYTKNLSTTADIKDADLDIFVDLLESMAANRIAMERAKSTALAAFDVQTPEYRISSKAIMYWRDHATQMKTQFIDKCQAGHAAVART